MNNYDDILEKIKNNLKDIKDYKIRKKARWLIRVIENIFIYGTATEILQLL